MAVSPKKHIFRTFNVKTLTNSSEEIKVKDVMLCLCTILSLTAKTFLSAVKYSSILSINLLPEFVKPKEVLPWVQGVACNDEFEAGQSEKYLTKTGKLRRKSLYHPSHTPPLPPRFVLPRTRIKLPSPPPSSLTSTRHLVSCR